MHKHFCLSSALRFVVMALVLTMAMGVNAQITTSSLSGQVTEPNGEPLIGASVVAVHQPSGTRYATSTNLDGRYSIEGMRVGGPYHIDYSYVGKQSVILDDINLELGENTQLDIYLEDKTTELSEVVVRGKGSKFIQAKTGATTNISGAMINAMPTVNRSISDIAKLSPYSNGMSFAGADGRSTNFTIDGSNFNNNFGLSSKLPGGGNPISLEAIDEMQIVVSPFDVRQTNFIGGGINAITKSGTNTFKGSAYVYYTDQTLRGNRIDGLDLGTRADASRTIYGFTVGGPIIKNKLFFFVNFEHESNPGEVVLYKACGPGMTPGGMVSRTTTADLQRVSDHLMSRYNYDPGSYTNFPGDESNNRLLARLDWNITDRHRLGVRFNYTKNTAWNAPNGNSSDTGYRLNGTYRVGTQSMAFANSLYSMDNKVLSFSADLNSRFNDRVSNQLLATYTHIADMRGTNSDPFPFIDIMAGYGADGNPILEPYMSAGYELFTYNNGVKNNVLSITDNVKWLLGSHVLTGGLAFEHQMASNAYMRNGTGYYRYNSVDDFINGAAPESFALTYGFNGEKEPSAKVVFNQIGIYLQDEWNINRLFKLSYGIRLDELMFDNGALERNNAIYDLDFGGKHIDTGLWPKNRMQVSPRLGFNWDVLGDKNLTVRGGTGIFTGRLPLVFFTNMPTNANLVQNSVQFKTTYDKSGVPVSHDPRLDQLAGGMITDMDQVISMFGLPTSNEKHVASSKISGVDADFKMPQVWKTSVGVDYRLPVSFPLYVSGELIYMRNFNSVNITNWNIKPESEWSSVERFAGPDNRVIYPSDKSYQYVPGTNAVVLTNSSKGHGLIESFTINARPIENLGIMASYTHTANTEVSGMPGSDPVSTWQGLITVDGPNFADVQCSQYVVPNKLIASVDWKIPFTYNGLKRNTNLSLFYSGYSFSGYSYCYSNDMNGDGINNDLMYIPRNDDEIRFKTTADRDAFWAFVEQDSYLRNHKGQYAEAYSARSPWTHRFDFRLMEEFEFRVGQAKHAIQLSFDIMNIGNLFNSKWGVARTNYICNNSRILKYEGMTADRMPMFSMVKVNGEYPTQSYDYLRENTQCWQFQIGVKYIFN
ncbi:MAG: TonB-dependent receptor [Muribaculaceae bacterium]|nr:TonB-dependent receptor [Muribaculaceae bacterium]